MAEFLKLLDGWMTVKLTVLLVMAGLAVNIALDGIAGALSRKSGKSE